MPASMPNTPMFVIEIVPPVRSAGLVRPARAVSASPAIASASSMSVIRSAPFTFGTTRPRSVAAAMPRFTWPKRTISWASSSQREFTSGVRPAAMQSAFATTVSGVTRCPANARSSRMPRSSSIVAVTSIVRNSVTCGAVNALRTIAAAVCLRTPLIGMRVSAGRSAPTCTAAGELLGLGGAQVPPRMPRPPRRPA